MLWNISLASEIHVNINSQGIGIHLRGGGTSPRPFRPLLQPEVNR